MHNLVAKKVTSQIEKTLSFFQQLENEQKTPTWLRRNSQSFVLPCQSFVLANLCLAQKPYKHTSKKGSVKNISPHPFN